MAFHETFKMPKLSALKQKTFAMASKRGQNMPKTKVTKMIQFQNFITIIICEDLKNAKIIQKNLLGEAPLT